MAGIDTNTTLMLHADGPDGSLEVLDSGNTGHVVTQVATAQLSTGSTVFGSSSLLLDGNSDYLSIPDSADWNMGDTFTIETWIRWNTVGDTFITGQFVGSGDNWEIYYTAGAIVLNINGSALLTYTITPSVDTWYHLAVSVSSGIGAIYIDGVQSPTNSSISINDEAVPLLIGQLGSSWYHNGYMDEFRISTIARYSAAFTSSTTAFVSDTATTLLLHMDTQDVSGDGGSDLYHIPDFIGTAQLDTAEYKWGPSSLLFDGNSDYLTIPQSTEWDVGSSTFQDYTIDFWVKFGDHAGYENMVSHYEGTANMWEFYNRHGRDMTFRVVTANSPVVDLKGPEIEDTEWHHLAMCKVTSGGPTVEWALYVDGIQTAYLSDTSTDTYTGPLIIGQRGDGNNWFNGHLDEIRIQKANWFTAAPNVGTSDTITVPTGPYTVVASPTGPTISIRRIFLIT